MDDLVNLPWVQDRPGVFKVKVGNRTHTRFVCPDCQRTVYPECPMLTDAIWNLACPEGGIFCLDCVEKRLGRELTLQDVANNDGFATLTYRILIERIHDAQHATH
jgi:hypothetical protein